jgi:hypothetical protein
MEIERLRHSIFEASEEKLDLSAGHAFEGL